MSDRRKRSHESSDRTRVGHGSWPRRGTRTRHTTRSTSRAIRVISPGISLHPPVSVSDEMDVWHGAIVQRPVWSFRSNSTHCTTSIEWRHHLLTICWYGVVRWLELTIPSPSVVLMLWWVCSPRLGILGMERTSRRRGTGVP